MFYYRTILYRKADPRYPSFRTGERNSGNVRTNDFFFFSFRWLSVFLFDGWMDGVSEGGTEVNQAVVYSRREPGGDSRRKDRGDEDVKR